MVKFSPGIPIKAGRGRQPGAAGEYNAWADASKTGSGGSGMERRADAYIRRLQAMITQ